ncbi:MAG TPA: RidA family protein [Burkholderiales bacterium]|nr:RidA family protein [Burkholderiales bacterium]
MSADVKMINPDSMGKPLGQYSQIARVKGAGELVFIAGQLATDKAGNLVGADDFGAQCAQVYANIEAALKAVGGGWKNVVQFTTYLVHSQDVPKLRAFRQHEFAKFFPDGAYPPNTLLIIDRLVGEQYLLEVQAVAAL